LKLPYESDGKRNVNPKPIGSDKTFACESPLGNAALTDIWLFESSRAQALRSSPSATQGPFATFLSPAGTADQQPGIMTTWSLRQFVTNAQNSRLPGQKRKIRRYPC